MILEAKAPKLTTANVYKAQQAALVRLQIFAIGATARLLRGVYTAARDALDKHHSAGGKVDGLAAYQVSQVTKSAWREFINEYTTIIETLTYEAAAVAAGPLAVLHTDYFDAAQKLEERQEDDVLSAILQRVVDQSRAETLGSKNPKKFSDRIWQLDQDGQDGIERIIANALAKGQSATEAAKELEQFLAPGANCPRWAKERLRNLSKRQIASGNRLGLLSGDECNGQGVAYNALRLMRTEIQRHHHITTDYLMERQPWIEAVQINLSPDHAVEDVCDEVIAKGKKGKGIYPKGKAPQRPFHPHCLCYVTAVLGDRDEFVNDLRAWMRGGSNPALDQYRQMWNGQEPATLDFGGSYLAAALTRWLSSDAGELSRGLGVLL